MKKRYTAVIFLSVCLLVSITGNVLQFTSDGGNYAPVLLQKDANSRDTYFTIHHVREAQEIATGEGVKVGVIDAFFDMEGDPGLYAGGRDFSGNPDALNKERSHGWLMARVLREIAPDCEIYALNLSHESEEKQVASIIEAIEWAEQNELDVLTLSQAQVPDKLRAGLDEAVSHAVDNGIVTCFIHYDNPDNILPYSTTPYGGDYSRDCLRRNTNSF